MGEMLNIKASAKAYVAALVAGLYAIQDAIVDGVTGQEWVGIVLAIILSFQATWWVPNRSAVIEMEPEPDHE